MNKTATHYFVYVGHGTQTKNKLQYDFKQYLTSLDGRLIDAKDLILLQKEIIATAQDLNMLYSRCMPIGISFQKLSTCTGFMIDGFCFLTFQIRPAFYAT
jgi:hypothetical protein